jgi:4-amino-4-deoxy-L-arabinose transferase-like glycosyltransferase
MQGSATLSAVLRAKWDYAVLSLLFLFNLIYDLLWLKRDTLPPGWDEAVHLTSTLAYFNILTHPSASMISNLIGVDNYYPPFYHFSTSLMYFFAKPSMDSAVFVNVFYLGILIFSTYGIGRKMFNREVGVSAAILVSLYPSIVGMQRFYLIELALVSTVTLCVYLLLLTDNFSNRRYSVLFGIALAIAVLTKWTAVFFLIGPLFFVGYYTFQHQLSPLLQRIHPSKTALECEQCGKTIERGVEYQGKMFCSHKCKNLWKKASKTKQRTSTTGKAIFNILLAFSIALILSLIWYAYHIEEVYRTISWGQQYWGTTEGDPEVFTLASLLYYALEFINFQASFLLAIPFVAGLVYLLRSKNKQLVFFALWMAIPYVVFTLLRNKDSRYTLPFIAAVAIISVFWVFEQKRVKPYRYYILAAVFGIGILQIATLALDMNISDAVTLHTSVGALELYPNHVYGTRPPISEDWKVDVAVDAIYRDAQSNPRMQGRIGYIGVVPDTAYINGLTFNYYCFKEKLPFQALNLAYMNPQDFARNFAAFDYLVFKSGENSGYSNQQKVTYMYEFFKQNNQGETKIYTPILSEALPDGSTLTIYRNTYLPSKP